MGDHYVSSSDEEGDLYRLVQRSDRTKKLSDKKRQSTATFKSWVEKSQREISKKSNTDVNSELLSVARLVKGNESNRIIATPREYQLDLFERAKQKNTIVVLDTGSGKTLIAALLIRHTIEQELEDRVCGTATKRVTFFLVEKVALCFQQFAVLECNLDYPIAKFFGDMTGVMRTKEFWDQQLEGNMVLVCTAQILLDCLNNGFVTIDQINLLIFDEAHHTKKNHPYARIMKNHYMQTKEKRPRVLGMTASPVDTRTSDMKAAAMELESMLCSEIATVSNEMLYQNSAQKNQVETVETYRKLFPPEMAKTHLWCQIADTIYQNAHFRAPLEFTKEASSTLGKWCADRYWQLLLTDTEVARLAARTDRDFAHSLGSAQSEQASEAIKAVQRLLENHKLDAVRPTSRDLSTKVMMLYQILHDEFTLYGTRRCIVFVEKRHTACLLSDLFEQLTMKIPGVDTAYMVGCQSTTANLGNMSFRDQVLTLAKFKNGDINCLFATPVAEEGIDIPKCDLIIRFDLYQSLIQYLQSKGRARQQNSKYKVMIEEGNLEHHRSVTRAVKDSSSLKRFCLTLPENRKVEDMNIDMEALAQIEMASQKVYESPKGAKMTLSHSLDVLAKFASSLTVPGEGSSKAEYITTAVGRKFVADIILPESSPIKSMSGFPQRSKLLARCSAAWETCVALIQRKYIDDYLQPAFTKKIPAMRNARLAVSSNKKDEYNLRLRPEVWSRLGDGVPEELFATVLRLDSPEAARGNVRPMILFSHHKMPKLANIPLYFGNERPSLMILTVVDEPVRLTLREVGGLAEFTLRVFEDVFSKQYDASPEELPYYLAPCIRESSELEDMHARIDWPTIELCREESLDWEGQSEDFFEEKFVTDPYDGSRKMFIRGINKSLKPSDPTPDGVPLPKSRGYRTVDQTISEYSNSLYQRARKRRQWREDQPVVNAELLSLRRNFLDEFQVGEKVENRCYVILEPLKVSPLPVDVVTMAMTFPAIIHRIDAGLIALDACSLLDLSIQPPLALEALTKDSDNAGDRGEEQINFQVGMGNNYERLEFLGDTFLKMAVTISIFTHFPKSDECESHVERMLLICNQNLFNHAVDRGLQEYVRSKSFDRRAWHPNLRLKKGKAPKTELRHTLANKTIADVCEALIGAAYLSGDGSFDEAVKAVTKMVKGKNHKMKKFSDYYAAYTKPDWQSASSSAAQRLVVAKLKETIGYEFQSPTLLRSAFKHPSYPSWEHIPHYQRLEFLGDALLDMSIVDYLFKRFPGADPQWLTEHKMAMVSNQFLGCVCAKLNLHKNLLTTSSPLLGQIAQYVNELAEAENASIGENKPGDESVRLDYWLSASHPPKALADIVEALLGAMFVDSEFDYSVIRSFFTRFIQPFFEDMNLYDNYASKHPVTSLTRRLQQDLFCSDWRLCVTEVPADADTGVQALTQSDVVCALVVHGNVMVHATAASGRYAKVAVAKKALGRFAEMDREAFKKDVGCNCAIGETTS